MSSLFIPSGFLAARAATPEPGLNVADYVFFDARFTLAKDLAASLARKSLLTPVQGDITAIWNTRLKHASMQRPLVMHGVTTESFYFCLTVMLGSHARIKTQVNRVDPDLFQWTIQSENNSNKG